MSAPDCGLGLCSLITTLKRKTGRERGAVSARSIIADGGVGRGFSAACGVASVKIATPQAAAGGSRQFHLGRFEHKFVVGLGRRVDLQLLDAPAGVLERAA